jgi:NADPH:quinone reductase-like Zn-dependent oxidoreductase
VAPSPSGARRRHRRKHSPELCGTTGGAVAEPTVSNHDGAGVVDKLGAGVAGFSAGERVWVTLAGDDRPASGTAAAVLGSVLTSAYI